MGYTAITAITSVWVWEAEAARHRHCDGHCHGSSGGARRGAAHPRGRLPDVRSGPGNDTPSPPESPAPGPGPAPDAGPCPYGPVDGAVDRRPPAEVHAVMTDGPALAAVRRAFAEEDLMDAVARLLMGKVATEPLHSATYAALCVDLDQGLAAFERDGAAVRGMPLRGRSSRGGRC